MQQSGGFFLVLCLITITSFAASLQPPKTRTTLWKQATTTKTFLSPSNESPLIEINVKYDTRTSLRYDPQLERYVTVEKVDPSEVVCVNVDFPAKTLIRKRFLRKAQNSFFPFLKRSFFPIGVTPSYYRFVKYRVVQRFLNSIVHVLGTQSLLMGLGLKSKALGPSAALNWVLKDALGKLVRLIWASRMGGKFDSDAKRWRFRSSLVFALGNALEIVTYVNPGLFLLWATLANCCKQISMLTSSSTRTALYNSFRTAENIADITAKGEAQIAVVDLMGIACGIVISKNIGTRAANLIAVYLALQVTEMCCIYRMIHAVEFRVLNFERLIQICNKFVQSVQEDEPIILPTPMETARKEKIFLPPAHLDRRANAFGSLSRAKLAPDELQELLKIFESERFLLVVGENLKHRPLLRRSNVLLPVENCHVVLHANATNNDIVKSTLSLAFLRYTLSDLSEQTTSLSSSLRSRDCYTEIRNAYEQCDRWFPTLIKSMSMQGWAPARFMFGQVSMRAVWPLTTPSSSSRVKQRSLQKEGNSTAPNLVIESKS